MQTRFCSQKGRRIARLDPSSCYGFFSTRRRHAISSSLASSVSRENICDWSQRKTLTDTSPDCNRIMATVATEQVKAVPRPFFSPIIERKINSGNVAPIKFDPDRHLVRKMPTSKVMMKDMGFPEDRGVSPVAVSEPFKLFTQEAIEQMRAEIFNPQMMKECGFKSHLAPFQLRGYAKK